MVQPPASLQVDGLSASGVCGRVNITVEGDLMCEAPDGIQVRNADTLNTTRTVSDTNTTVWCEIIQPKDVMVASCFNEKEKLAEVVLLDPNTLQKTHSLYKSLVNTFTAYRIAQFQTIVYTLDVRKKLLIVCTLLGNAVEKFPIPEIMDPQSLCILPDSNILIGDCTENGKVIRYKLDNSTLVKIWEFPGISQPTGMSYDLNSELIYICTERGPLFILSLEGKAIIVLFS